ncbi:hypothetical protein BN970_03344 [Mycolicibacterium conceptionense]|uniref:Uncharacterized protein n=1 Tax=Mycolicibacterium conceptionense TaxID=451644 RepID=A0A0U1DHL4_9MYCO|nr:hypothetical protein [Mycolicibacterium conceptionense]CQD15864.1 hypothetical protein BN970_03344 [Mycolicibacterium conceptionense]
MQHPTVDHDERHRTIQEVNLTLARFLIEVRLRNKAVPVPESDGEGLHYVGWSTDPGDYQGRHRAAEVAAA